jgi:hypothetical protein
MPQPCKLGLGSLLLLVRKSPLEYTKVTKFIEGGKLFLHTFLLDSTKNNNDWKVTQASIPEHINSFIDAPFVLTESYQHPEWINGVGPLGNLEYQERYAIGRIRQVLQTAGLWDAIIEITDPQAKEAIEKEEIPFYVSPKIIHNPDNPDDAISDWAGLHLAVVSKPAYGVEKATFKGACYGAAQECKVALTKSAAENPGCGFCVKSAMLKLVTNNSSHYTSLEREENKSQTSMGDSTQTEKVDLSGYVPKGELEAVKAAFEAKIVETENKYAQKIASFEEERRKESIATIVNSKYTDAKQAEEVAKKFVDAKVSPEFVKDILAKVPDPKRDNSELFTGAVKEASSKAGSYELARKYTNSIIRGASI